MANKKKNQPTEESSTTARPRMLVVVVVLATAISSWYWYQPLSDPSPGIDPMAASASNYPEMHRTLIEPNTNDSSPASSAEVPVYSALPEDLVGERQVAVRPFQPTPQGTLREVLSKEPLPVIPISRPDRTRPDNQSALVAARPPLWTTSDSPNADPNAARFGESIASRSGAALGMNANPQSNDWDRQSPFPSRSATQVAGSTTAGSIAASSGLAQGDRIVAIEPPRPVASAWPDASYKPDARPSETPSIAKSKPNPPLRMRTTDSPLLASQGIGQSGKISVSESQAEDSNGPHRSDVAGSRRTVPTAWSSGPSVSPQRDPPQRDPTGKKSGAVIRQPAKP
ncbi:MAG: hypothetical protein NT168_14035 [Planctomycetota bacterium]|jgi:hypothetical protein|nr:hypothetical protein [Planctomycetota bacterium]